MFQTKTIIEAVHYILQKLSKSHKTKIIKLLFIADKYHLLKYGRTITGDVYFALPFGPVGSNIKDFVNFNADSLSKEELSELKKYFRQTADGQLEISSAIDNYEFLSESDKEVLDAVVQHFGNWNVRKLNAYTHKHPEWKKYEKEFNKGYSSRFPIKKEEMLSIPENDNFFQFDEEHVNQSKQIVVSSISW